MNCFNCLKNSTNEDEIYSHSSNEEMISDKEEIHDLKYSIPDKEEDILDYNMEHKKRGICVIFNQLEFLDKKRCPTRNGTDYDCSKLETRFGALGFKVLVHKDLTFDEILKVIKDVSSQDHSEEDCFVCCVLTHGLENGYIFAKDREYKLFLLMNYFTPISCPTLDQKPKIFIIQACRGRKFDDGVNVAVTDSPRSLMSSSFIPPNPDFLVIFSSMADHYSFRDTQCGTWLIQTLTNFMLDYNQQDIDFLSLLTKVNRFVAFQYKSRTNSKQSNDKKQTINISHTLTKRIFFKFKNT